MAHPPELLVAGGGIGGLSAALACARAGAHIRLFEQADAFGEVGAGIQLGPNAVRVLQAWGLGAALDGVVARPKALQVMRADSGERLATLPLGAAMQDRYGAPYLTIHRADLHAVLLAAVQAQGATALRTGCAVHAVAQTSDAVQLQLADPAGQGLTVEGDALVGADGLWSRVRGAWAGDAAARYSGHLAWRALVRQADLPAALRSQDVTVWLGERLHLVHYPVRGGEWLNIAGFVEGPRPPDIANWDIAPADLPARAGGLPAALRDAAGPLGALSEAVPHWRLWALCGRAPVSGADALVQGRVALLGDAAHPMLPYLAQGAGMAIEDAAELASSLAMNDMELPLRLRRYALNRWQRVARVQRRSLRNGGIFHASGPLRVARDLSLRLLGARLLDMPWLYGHGPAPEVLSNQ